MLLQPKPREDRVAHKGKMMSKTQEANKAQTPSQVASEFKDFKNNRTAIVDAMAAAVMPTQGKLLGPVQAVNDLPKPQTPAPTVDASGLPDPVAPPAADAPMPASESPVDKDLAYILSQPRGHDGENEKKFCNWLITKLNKLGHKPTLMEENCIYVAVGAVPAEADTLFSCHVDTVDSSSDKQQKKLTYDPAFQHIMLEKEEPKTFPKGNDPAWKGQGGHNGYWQGGKHHSYSSSGPSCLGADDGAGVWIMLKMIEAGVKGGYIFNRGEEKGGISSRAMANRKKEWLSQFKAAVAFDRPKDFEVITHQRSQRCCSDEFAKALAAALSENPDDELKFETSDRGVFTDTANWTSEIAECTNIGVGYYDHHGSGEYLDYSHLKQLLDRCLKIDWQKLPIVRDPKKVEPGKWSYQNQGGYGGSSKVSSPAPAPAPAAAAKGAGKPSIVDHKFDTTLETLFNEASSYETIMDWFDMDPELTAKCVMAALIDGRTAQLQYNMLLKKTLKA